MLYGSDEFENERSKNCVDVEEKLLCFWLKEVPRECTKISVIIKRFFLFYQKKYFITTFISTDVGFSAICMNS